MVDLISIKLKKIVVKTKHVNMDIVYHNESTGTSEKVVDITKIPKENVPYAIKQFSEGSSSLEKCLQSIYNAGVVTRACCKENHIEVNEDGNNSMADINSEAYILFKKNSDWYAYLLPQIIEDKFVVIEDDCIRYYGENHDVFFEKLSGDFMTEKKENKVLLNKKKDSYRKE